MPPPPAPPTARADWVYFLDFDGTLVELAATPDAIRVDAALRLRLKALQIRVNGGLAIVTGRALSNLDRWLALPGLARAGQHGLERRSAAGQYVIHPMPPAMQETVVAAFAPLLAAHAGLLLEDKGASFAVHYHLAPRLGATVRRRMETVAARLEGQAVVQHGRNVAELKPAGICKGSAVAEFLEEAPFRGRRPVFIGDDRSDADAFAVINARDGISIAVGRSDLGARYALPGVAAVRAWLAAIT